MLPKVRRVSSKFFLENKKPSQRKSSSVFNIVFYKKDKDEEIDKFAVVVSKKISKKAVKRNYLKRVVYSVIRDIISGSDWKEKGFDVVVFIKKDFLGTNYNNIKKEIKKLILK